MSSFSNSSLYKEEVTLKRSPIQSDFYYVMSLGSRVTLDTKFIFFKSSNRFTKVNANVYINIY